ncbi:hypothetical protein PMAYCL1PPCAC_10344, partial [Pristionchus mayeri]
SSSSNRATKRSQTGPVRASKFLRQSVRMDFDPNICKDYKETGVRTFGESCKFIHDRGDYKQSWQLERDIKQGKTEQEETYEISDEEDESFPESCPICEGAFTNPVVTRCKHFFCEHCAITAFKKSKRCKVCEKNTAGVFNPAKDLIAHINGNTNKKTRTDYEEDINSDETESDENEIEEEDEGDGIEGEIVNEVDEDEEGVDNLSDDEEFDEEG